jgi:general secretion pathway protein H
MRRQRTVTRRCQTNRIRAKTLLKQHCEGFTLVELLVVMVIATLAVALVLPGFTNARTGMELKSGTRQLSSALRYARGLAISKHREVAVILDVEDRSYQYSNEQRKHNLSSSLNFRLLTNEGEILDDQSGAIRFFPDGSSTGGQITLQANNSHHEINVNWLTGRVSISE